MSEQEKERERKNVYGSGVCCVSLIERCVWQCVALCCSVLMSVLMMPSLMEGSKLHCVALRFIVLQCVAVYCSVLMMRIPYGRE